MKVNYSIVNSMPYGCIYSAIDKVLAMKEKEINQLTRKKEGKLYNYSCSCHIWLCSIVTDKILVVRYFNL